MLGGIDGSIGGMMLGGGEVFEREVLRPLLSFWWKVGCSVGGWRMVVVENPNPVG